MPGEYLRPVVISVACIQYLFLFQKRKERQSREATVRHVAQVFHSRIFLYLVVGSTVTKPAPRPRSHHFNHSIIVNIVGFLKLSRQGVQRRRTLIFTSGSLATNPVCKIHGTTLIGPNLHCNGLFERGQLEIAFLHGHSRKQLIVSLEILAESFQRMHPIDERNRIILTVAKASHMRRCSSFVYWASPCSVSVKSDWAL